MEPVVIESCHSTWEFDEERWRFRRLLRGLDIRGGPPTAWRPYFGLELDEDSDTFVVLLNPEGTRRLRSWRHLAGHCPCCDERRTEELRLEEVAGGR